MKEKIVTFLGQFPGRLPSVIADSLNMRADSVRKALTILRRQEKVTRASDGTYSLVAAPATVSTSQSGNLPVTVIITTMLEKILAVLTALVAAIEANTAALGAAPKAAGGKGKKDTTTETPAGTPTVQDVRDSAKALLDASANDDKGLFAKLNAKFGSKKISEVPEANRAEVIAAIKAAMPGKTEAAPAASEQI